eukprot:957666-Prymnesium_polylepis.2
MAIQSTVARTQDHRTGCCMGSNGDKSKRWSWGVRGAREVEERGAEGKGRDEAGACKRLPPHNRRRRAAARSPTLQSTRLFMSSPL